MARLGTYRHCCSLTCVQSLPLHRVLNMPASGTRFFLDNAAHNLSYLNCSAYRTPVVMVEAPCEVPHFHPCRGSQVLFRCEVRNTPDRMARLGCRRREDRGTVSYRRRLVWPRTLVLGSDSPYIGGMLWRNSRGGPLNAPAAFIHPCQPIVAK